MRIVLASESQCRKRAMNILGVAYEICPCDIHKKAIRDPDPFTLTVKLAEAKARKVAGYFPDFGK
jgi:predicted house-cleaning NTP pyrophosphatase (Maf/HAM1 superfamily)